MSSTFGNKIKISIFGESHQECIGAVVDGLPAGFTVDFGKISRFMSRRAPGSSSLVTQRKESDNVKIVSGLYNGATSDAPLCLLIENNNQNSADYGEKMIKPRPGHGDYTAWLHSGGFNDFRGGGHNSGRLTAPMCAVGNILMQIMEEKYGIKVYGRLYAVGGEYDGEIDSLNLSEYTEDFESIKSGEFPCILPEFQKNVGNIIKNLQEVHDSVGGIVEIFITNVPAGIGEPMFDGIENVISQAVFAIPGVKGIEFGDGFEMTQMYGSDCNDSFKISPNGEKIETVTNHCGGILAGRTTGNAITFRVAFKPTPSIGDTQQTVNLEEKTEEEINIQGRHDPCIAIRAVPAVEAAAAISIAQFLL